MAGQTVTECLEVLGMQPAKLAGLGSVDAEFGAIKRCYLATVLKCHPDKGGSAVEFRAVQSAFERLRDLYDSQSVGSSFLSAAAAPREWHFDDSGPMPSYEYYAAAADESEPVYRVELAKSGRSKCAVKVKLAKKCEEGAFIAKGEVRVGSMNFTSGTYGRWSHLPCWRVPARIWLGLPKLCGDPAADVDAVRSALTRMGGVVFSGFAELPPADQDTVIRHVMDQSNWARLTKNVNVPPAQMAESPAAAAAAASASAAAAAQPAVAPNALATTSSALVVGPNHFVTPIPGVNGAIPNILAGKTVVLTGVFPEVGGGAGLELGKAKARAMVEAFGGRVTGSVSGKTDILLVGKDPGFSKVSKARARSKITLLGLRDLKGIIEGQAQLDGALPTLQIASFSAGYTYVTGRQNGLAALASASALAIASGAQPAPMQLEGVKARKMSPAKAKAASVKREWEGPDAASPAKRVRA